MKSSVFLSFFIILFINLTLFSQTTNTRRWRKTERDTMFNAYVLFDEGKYLKGLPMWQKLYENHPKEEIIRYAYAKCAIYRVDLHDVALKLLNEIYEKNKKVENIEYDLAVVNHLNYKFDEALSYLNSFLLKKKLKIEDKILAEQLKKYCLYGKGYFSNPTDVKISNIGISANTMDDEYAPVISADESIMLYTYLGTKSTGGLQNEFFAPDKYGDSYEDVFQSVKVNNVWGEPTPVNNVNTNSHDGAIAMSPDGNYLFVYRANGDDHGDIYMSNHFNNEWSSPKKLQGGVNSYSWDGSCSITADGKNLYFSSERSGGFGGKDIYRATLLADSTWGDVVNLGDSINTKYDEDAPFIHADGTTLFFSSKGKTSMGGYDVFQTTLNLKDSTFNSPINLGYPINTPNDDINYVLSANGERGYYASGKKGGQGLKDIYTVSPGYIGDRPSLYLVSGFITENDWPISANISVETNGKIVGEYRSNPSSGKYLISIPKGGEYKIIYKDRSLPVKTLLVNTTNLEGFQSKINVVNFDTVPVVLITIPKADSVLSQPIAIITEKKPAKTEVKIVKTKTVLVKVAKEPVAVVNTQPKELEKPAMSATSATMLAKANLYVVKNGNVSYPDLSFRVQVAAYKFPKNYEYPHLKELGPIENVLLNDGITRITIGGIFNTLAQALEHNNKVLNAGQQDAFVTIIYKGNRLQYEDLVKMGVFVN